MALIQLPFNREDCYIRRNGVTAALAVLIGGISITTTSADTRLAAVFGDHMVLQRETEVAVWGWDDAGQAVTISPDWKEGKSVIATCDDSGKWFTKIPTPKAGGPYSIAITGSTATALHDVMIGEVWLCSGQSNMEMPVGNFRGWHSGVLNYEKEIGDSIHYPNIRFFTVKNTASLEALDDCQGNWSACSPKTVKGFSAAGYFFGRNLNDKLDVPIGLISSDYGGTVVQAWMSRDALEHYKVFKTALKQEELIKDSAPEKKRKRIRPNLPGVLYNGMIAPIVPFTIRGVIWYQGESNRSTWKSYTPWFSGLIGDWRSKFGVGDFPFYFVQIAPFNYRGDAGQTALLREAQSKVAKSVTNTGMVVTLDIGNRQNVHPKNKQEVGRRLALLALNQTYGYEHTECFGPVFRSVQFDGSKAIVSFDHVGDGLVVKGDELQGFVLAGNDKQFHKARAVVDGDRVIVQSDEVEKPTAVRYGWSAVPEVNLFNKAGLPAAPFRSDDY